MQNRLWKYMMFFWYHVKHGKSTGKVVLHEKTQRHVKHAAWILEPTGWRFANQSMRYIPHMRFCLQDSQTIPRCSLRYIPQRRLWFTQNHKGIHDSNGGASLTQMKLSGSNTQQCGGMPLFFPSHAHEVTVSQHRFDVHHFRLHDLHKMFHAVASVHGP